MVQPYKLKDIVPCLEPIAEWGPHGVRELSKRLRWEGGWQGAGPLSYRSLKRTVGGNSLRETLHAVDAVNPPTSLRQAYERLGFPLGGGVTRLPDGPISLRQIARRVLAPDVVSLKFLSYNTYLLQGLHIPVGQWVDDVVGWDALSLFNIALDAALLGLLGVAIPPLGVALIAALKVAGLTPSKVIKQVTGLDLNDINIGAKPALEARASELGPVLKDYDVCCLCEVWTQDSRDRIHNGLDSSENRVWESASGPDESGAFKITGSGLFFLVKNRHIVNKTEKIIYANRGTNNHDADAWSNKGAMLNVIDVGFGQLELFQTHFYFGGGIPLLSEPSYEDRMSVWRAELAELADFYHNHHQPQNVAIITGDFNMSSANVRESAEIRRIMDSLNMRDLWEWDIYKHSPSAGLTCRYTDGDIGGWKRDFANECSDLIEPDGQAYCDDVETSHSGFDDHGAFTPPPPFGVGRYDHIFAENPTASHKYKLEVSRMLRRTFRRNQASDNETFLSDHLGLDVTLYLSPR